MSMERRDLLASRLVEWFHQVLDGDAPPAGLAAEVMDALEDDEEGGAYEGEVNDWYAMHAALTALTQETRLQSRAFDKLNQRLAEVPSGKAVAEGASFALLQGTVSDMRDALDALAKQSRRESSPVSDDAMPKEAILLLMDVRDRLLQAHDTAKTALDDTLSALPTSWLKHFLTRHAASHILDGYQELLKGYSISIERLTDELARHEVFEIGAVGDMFDPMVMKTVDIEERVDETEGTVIAVYRRGYQWRGTTLRPAEVKVVRSVSEARNQTSERNPV